MAGGEFVWCAKGTNDWDTEVRRFFDNMAAFDRVLASDASLSLNRSPEMLVQGPLADALTHVGQIVMLRRMAGAPIRSTGYFEAEIR